MRLLGACAVLVVVLAPSARAELLVGLTTNNNLVTFSSGNPGTNLAVVTVTGLQPGENVLAIDFRPSDGRLYGLGSSSRLYRIDPQTGEAAAVGPPGAFTLSGTSFGFDFNPVTGRARVVSDADQNLRLNADTGILTATDTALNPGNPTVVGIAYSNNLPEATTTTLYGIDSAANTLVTLASPNGGTVTTIGPLGFDVSGAAGFDISPRGVPFLMHGQTLYTVNPSTGAATLVGTNMTGFTFRGLAAWARPEIQVLTAHLTGTQEVPANASRNRGTVSILFDPGGQTIDVTAFLRGIPSALVTGFHLHATAAIGANAPIVINLGLSFSDVPGGARFTGATSVPVPDTVVFSLLNGLTYVDVHTSTILAGEVRGQVGAKVLVSGAGAGGGPHVRVFDPATSTGTGAPRLEFFAYDGAFAGGVRVAACDVNGDGIPDIVTGPGAGGGPHVKVFDGRTGTQLPGRIGSFFALDPGFTAGVYVGCADLNGDGLGDVIVGAGPGGGPHVRAFDGATGDEISTFLGSFFAYGPGFTGGVFVGGGH